MKIPGQVPLGRSHCGARRPSEETMMLEQKRVVAQIAVGSLIAAAAIGLVILYPRAIWRASLRFVYLFFSFSSILHFCRCIRLGPSSRLVRASH